VELYPWEAYSTPPPEPLAGGYFPRTPLSTLSYSGLAARVLGMVWHRGNLVL